ncbi:MAG TPA: flagellar motor protein [Polyangiaceae bacterium]|nr:flagellar motor protein [Polyangiaceae bacterium]
MDLGTIFGLLLGIGMILGGDLLEGGKISQILQPTAAMIVFGGTIGATMIQFPLRTFLRALKAAKTVLIEPKNQAAKLIEDIVGFAIIARKDGIVSLENVIPDTTHPFLRRALMMAIDGADSAAMRLALETSISQSEEEGEDVARVYETAGGYAPTIGIIGAVLGLIQVMSHLSDIEKVGEGIATAFVATIYGVGFANIFCLPLGGKLKLRNREAIAVREIMLEGALAIQEGMNPKLVRERLATLAQEVEAELLAAEGDRSQVKAAA